MRLLLVGDHRSRPARRGRSLDLDVAVPALIMKVGRYPVHHGSVGLVRSLGRLGVPVYAVTEDRLTPTARSHYLRRAFVWPTDATERPEDLIGRLLEIGQEIGRRSVLLATDDEAAVLLAEHASTLAERFLLPPLPPALPRRLASKWGLCELCTEHGIPTPVSQGAASIEELWRAAERIGFPVVLKNDEPWQRLTRPAVTHTTLVRSAGALRELIASWPAMPSVLVQEYLPSEQAEDWIVHAYRPAHGEQALIFTGIKLRSWPMDAGVTAIARSTPNRQLVELAGSLLRSVGYRGIADMDWRLDGRDGSYKLVDFNPRVGAQFRMFETVDGVDVARALHLDLTGRPLPLSAQVDGRRYVAEHLALAASVSAGRGERSVAWPARDAPGGIERAWLAADDPLPGLLTAARCAVPAARAASLVLRRRLRHR